MEYDHSRESIIVGSRLFDINDYRRCLKIIRIHLGGRLSEGGDYSRGATIRGNTVVHLLIVNILEHSLYRI